MKELLNFLDKYKNLKPPHESKIKLLVSTIKDECGIILTEKDISIRRGGAIISCHPAVRSEILRSSPQLLEILNNKYKIRLSFIR